MKTHAKARQAFTILELVISTAIFAVMMTMVGQSLTMGSSMHESVTTNSDLTDRADRVIHKIAGNLRAADYNWIYLNEGMVSTYTFKLCTGLNKDGPVFRNQYVLTYDTANNRLLGTLQELDADGKVTGIIREDIAEGLVPETGFMIAKMNASGISAGDIVDGEGFGTAEDALGDVIVKGNQLQLTLALQQETTDGQILTKSVTTTVFLRSTMYANTNLTSSVTDVMLSESSSDPVVTVDPDTGDVTTSDPSTIGLTLGSDTNTSQKKVNKVWMNEFLILGEITKQAESTETPAYNTFELVVDKANNGTDAQYTIRRGWVPAEATSGNGANKVTLSEGQFLLDGWVNGSLNVTATIQNNDGATITAHQQY